MKPVLKIGDNIILDCPKYKVFKCRAEVVGFSSTTKAPLISPIDGQLFPHSNFKNNGVHALEKSDTYVILIKNNLPEDLFKI